MAIKIIAKNKRAHFDYFLKDKIEAGIVLAGTEVKSLRQDKVNLMESHITIDKNHEIWIHNLIIPHYAFGNLNNHVENRKRKLLLNKLEIKKWSHTQQAEGLTIVPTMIYFSKGKVKLEIALGKGKKKHDKRQAQAERDVQRKLQRGDYH